MASNENWLVPAGEHERRYAVFEVSEEKRQDDDWFAPLYKQLENGGYGAMLHDLLHRDLGGWHPRQIPMTKALREQQMRSLEPTDAWIVGLFEEGILPRSMEVNHPNRALSRSKPDVDGRNPRAGLFDVARDRDSRLRHISDQVLAGCLSKWGCIPWRDSQARGWEFPPLKDCRARWEEKYPGWEWQHPELLEWQAETTTFPSDRPSF